MSQAINSIQIAGDAPHLDIASVSTAQPHYAPTTFGDHFAWIATKTLRGLADACFRKHYMHRAVVLETVAAVPGMVGAVLQHLRSLRLFSGRPDLVHLLLEEAENERMHLMTFVALCKPNAIERLLVLLSQGMFFNAFFLLYLIAPKVAYRLVGYFEEEAVVSYTAFLAAIDRGDIENVAIPEFARDYCRLAPEAMLRELVVAVREDEMGHRDVNHGLVETV
jgi:ubiquinol oxidase